MPLNQKKIVQIILQELQKVEERCKGYREEIRDVVIDILEAERQHRVHGTNIQIKVNDKIDAAGQYLTKQKQECRGNK